MNNLQKFIVLDTETTNSMDDPLVYDIGFLVCDAYGKIYEEHSYAIAETFFNKELMENAYYADRIPNYWKEIKNGERQIKRLLTVKMILKDVMRKYNTNIVCCHNARFDDMALKTTNRYYTSSRWRFFLPYGTEVWDTLKMSRKVLKDSEEYKTFCEENEFLTERYKKPQFTAEVLYRYLTNNVNFEEMHEGLGDVRIEKEILCFCIDNGVREYGKLYE